jgi:streptogramin lyase
MQNRYRRSLLMVTVLVGAAVGFATQALAQTFNEFPLPTAGSAPFGITTGPDGALWFTESGTNKIGRIATTGAITEFQLSPGLNASPVGITAGPDGALWFANSSGIGRITTAGAITQFASSMGSPQGITVGPDGALWYTKPNANNIIGRITTAGIVTEFMTPTAAAEPVGITAGSDGALWFTEYAANKIGRITIAGAITEFSIATANNSAPYAITSGPDGALWYTGARDNTIGRVTTTGAFQIFNIPSVAASVPGPQGITVGPDGAIWFTTNQYVGRITTDGVITAEYQVPTANNQLLGITTGPDGNLWFTEYAANKIGRLSVPALKVSPATNIAASGTQGGAFSPTSFSYQLSATSDSLNYLISGIPAWLNANFTSGTATTLPVTVTFSLTNLGNLAPGTYAATIAFTNTSLGYGSTTRTATLTVNPGTKDGCNNVGWQNYISFPGPFKNQGQCVTYFANQ